MTTFEHPNPAAMRPGLRSLAALAICCLLLLGLFAVVNPRAQATPADEDVLTRRINDERASAGLPAMTVDVELVDIARNHAGRMAAEGRVFPNPRLRKWIAGSSGSQENVGSGPDAEAVHQSFFANEAFKANMLGDYDRVGIGAIRSGGVLYVNEIFSKSAEEPQKDPLPGPDEKRGVRYGGLERPKEGRCSDSFKTVKSKRCSHGPDPAPEGVDVAADRPPVSAAGAAGTGTSGTAAGGGSIACEGDGVSGKRFQAIYARASDRTDRYATYAPSIGQWAAAADKVFNDSAGVTGGSRRLRWVTDSACSLSVANVTLSSTADDNFDNTINELYSKGFNRTDRVYVIWMDANVYCGIAALDIDDSPGATNANNTGPGYARTDSGCWGLANPVEAHEILHTIGGVQRSAPHSTYRLNPTAPGTFHCFDESDRMCYPDAPLVTMQNVCSDPARERLFDCQNDDYFHTAPAAGSYLATYWNSANSDFLIKAQAAPPPAPPPAPSIRFSPLTPARILDTRNGTGGISSAIGAGKTVNVQVTGRGGVPSTGVSAVVLNVTATKPSTTGSLTAFSAGSTRPGTPNVHFTANQTAANVVVVKPGTNGQISIYNGAGTVHVMADVQGFYSEASTSGYSSLAPARILDTRNGTGGISTAIGAGKTVNVQVTGRGGVPSTGVSAVVLNLTATQPSSSGALTAFSTGAGRPGTPNVHFTANRTVANVVVAKPGTNGQISIYNSAGTVHVMADVQGFYSEASTGAYSTVAPARILDTLNGTGGISGAVGAGKTINVQLTDRAGVPSTGVSAVVLNLSATRPSTTGSLTAFSTGSTRPTTPNLHFTANKTVANAVVVRPGTNGQISIYNSAGTVHVMADVHGYYTEASPAAAQPSSAQGLRTASANDGDSSAPGSGAAARGPAGPVAPSVPGNQSPGSGTSTGGPKALRLDVPLESVVPMVPVRVTAEVPIPDI